MENKLLGTLLSAAYEYDDVKVKYILENINYKFLSKNGKKILGIIKQNLLKNEILNYDDLKLSLEKNNIGEYCSNLLIDTVYDNDLYKKYVDDVKNNYITHRIETIKKYDDKQKVLMIRELSDDVANFEEKKIETMNMTKLCLDYVNSLDEEEERIYTKNWNNFNNKIRMVKEDLNIICGRPGSGKSAYALALSLELAKSNFIGCFFSLEMSNRQIYKRMLAQVSKVKLVNLDSDNYRKLDDNSQKKVSLGMERLNEFTNKLEVAVGIFTIDDIDNYVSAVTQIKKLDYIIVDYLQLIKPTRNTSRGEIVTEISIGLKRIAMKHKITVIALSQLSREIESREDKVPRMSDLRESGQLEQDSSVIIGVYRDYYYTGNPDTKNTLETHIIKNRNGELGTIINTCALDYQFIGE